MYFLREQTVGISMQRAIHWWFGVQANSADVLRQKIPKGIDPYDLVDPWSTRLLTVRQHGTPEELQAVKHRIGALRPELRWAVVTYARTQGEYSPEEAREELTLLPASLFDSRVKLDLTDPLMDARYPQWIEILRKKARELLEER